MKIGGFTSAESRVGEAMLTFFVSHVGHVKTCRAVGAAAVFFACGFCHLCCGLVYPALCLHRGWPLGAV